MKLVKKVKKEKKQQDRLELARQFLYLTQQLINLCDDHSIMYDKKTALSDLIEEEVEGAFIEHFKLSSSDLDEISEASYPV